MKCLVCDLVCDLPSIKGSYRAYGERLCHACWVWSLRAAVQFEQYGRIRRLAPETLPQ